MLTNTILEFEQIALGKGKTTYNHIGSSIWLIPLRRLPSQIHQTFQEEPVGIFEVSCHHGKHKKKGTSHIISNKKEQTQTLVMNIALWDRPKSHPMQTHIPMRMDYRSFISQYDLVHSLRSYIINHRPHYELFYKRTSLENKGNRSQCILISKG